MNRHIAESENAGSVQHRGSVELVLPPFARSARSLWPAIWALMIFCPASMAQELAHGKSALPRGLEIEAHAEPDKATVGDPIRIDFDIRVPKGFQVRLPPLAGQVGDFTILETHPGPSIPDLPAKPADRKPGPTREGEPAHHYARILVALYKAGDYTFPPFQIALKDPSGKEMSFLSPAVKVRIESVLNGKDDVLRDLKKQAEIPEPTRWVLWLGIGLLALVLAIAAWLWWRRRRRTSAAPPLRSRVDPLQLAESELRDLLSRGLIEKNLIKEFYVILSEIVKKALEAGYGIHTVEKTTSEIMVELQLCPRRNGDEEEFELIESFLVACDLVKFARNRPSPFENDTAVKAAFEILGACRKQRSAATPATPVQAAEVH